MAWMGWSDFLAMGGYAPYVWGSFGVVLAALAGEQLALWLRYRAARKGAAAAGVAATAATGSRR